MDAFIGDNADHDLFERALTPKLQFAEKRASVDGFIPFMVISCDDEDEDAQSEPDLRAFARNEDVRLTRSEQCWSFEDCYWDDEEESLAASLDSSFADIRSISGEDTYFSMSYDHGAETSEPPTPSSENDPKRKIFRDGSDSEILESFRKCGQELLRTSVETTPKVSLVHNKSFEYDADDETFRPTKKWVAKRRSLEARLFLEEERSTSDETEPEECRESRDYDLEEIFQFAPPAKIPRVQTIFRCFAPWKLVCR
jgi:hypothetical protein